VGPTGLGGRSVTKVVQADLQGNILRGYGRKFKHGLYLFFRIDRPCLFGEWLDEHADEITTDAKRQARPPWTLNLALSFAGLSELGVSTEVLDSFPAPFQEGMESRAAKLGDVGESDPVCWDDRLKGVHGVITVWTLERKVRADWTEQLVAAAPGAGLEQPFPQETDVAEDGREPFGFADGISQPQIDDPNTGPKERRGDVPVKTGEFVVGYPDEGGVIAPAPEEIGVNGSYMVVRKLEQDVEGFWDYIRAEAGDDHQRGESLAAKIVGRWRDGTPLVRSPHAPGAEGDTLNDFTYAADPDGYRCPIGAHIRRTNPRDSFDRNWRFTNRHRIIRRGMPYCESDGSGKRGLLFVCFQASIERQFEFVQAHWMGDGNAFGLGSDPDFIAGPAEGKMTIQGDPPRFVPMQRFVTTRGGDYFFVPGIAALREIAARARAP
jgi:Dyp-type peroxidase family